MFFFQASENTHLTRLYRLSFLHNERKWPPLGNIYAWLPTSGSEKSGDWYDDPIM